MVQKSLDDSINLPGSMPEKLKGDEVTARTQWTGSLYDSSYYFNPYMEKYRIEGQVKLPFFLTPDKHYVGVAWYQKKVTIPSNWKGERISLFLERPHIETTVWVKPKELGMQNSLCVPHVYDLTSAVAPGKTCLITIRIDNRIKEINVGPDSHSITDQTQGNWNGIVGRIELQATPKIHFENIQVYPGFEQSESAGAYECTVRFFRQRRNHAFCREFQHGHPAQSCSRTANFQYPSGETMRLKWNFRWERIS